MESTTEPPDSRPWYEVAFGQDYLTLYAHRSEADALRLYASVERAFGWGGRTLDLACGAGRFLRAVPPPRPVVGCDLSEALLARAREAGRPLVRADMRALPFRSTSFGRVVLLFTSFGYFDSSAEDWGVVEEIARALAPGGLLVLDFLNARHLPTGLVPLSERVLESVRVTERRWVDPAGPFVYKEVILDSVDSVDSVGALGAVGEVPDREPRRRFVERVRLYTEGELTAGVSQAGLAMVATWGDYDGSPFDASASPRCLLVARKPPGGGGSPE